MKRILAFAMLLTMSAGAQVKRKKWPSKPNKRFHVLYGDQNKYRAS